MTTRRNLLLGVGGIALAGAGDAAGAFREAGAQVDSRLFGQSSVIETGAGALEYAVAGDGFDQGLPFAAALRAHQVGSVAVWCRSLERVMRSKGDEPWAQAGRMNFARMRCGSR